MNFYPKNNIYLDHASATPINKKVLRKMFKIEKCFYSNGSAIHKKGVKTREIIEQSRLEIANQINAHSDEIIFTGSGTESNALAIFGVVDFFKNNFPQIVPHIITSEIEHPAVLENIKLLEKKKLIEVSYIPVFPNGVINLKILENSIRGNTILVSIMYANNEIGTIQPIEEIAKIIRRYRKEKSIPQGLALGSLKARPSPVDFPLFHTDACQAINYLPMKNIEKLGVDLMTFNSSKIYGPKGIGVLVKKRNITLEKIYSGGGQEMGLRSGTESVSLIYGLAQALNITCKIKEKEIQRLTKLRDYGINKILNLSKKYPFKIYLNGDREKRLPNNINITIPELSSELLVIELSSLGIYVSEKSACKSESSDDSYVIEAIRGEKKRETGSIRITLGRQTKRKDLNKLTKGLSKILSKYKEWK